MMENLIVGIRQTRKFLYRGEATEVLIAQDADSVITGPLKEFCEKESIPVVEFPTMAELGKYCGIDIGASIACRVK